MWSPCARARESAGPRRPARFIVFIKRINLISLRGRRLDKPPSIGLTGATLGRDGAIRSPPPPPSPPPLPCAARVNRVCFKDQRESLEKGKLISIDGETVDVALVSF